MLIYRYRFPFAESGGVRHSPLSSLRLRASPRPRWGRWLILSALLTVTFIGGCRHRPDAAGSGTAAAPVSVQPAAPGAVADHGMVASGNRLASGAGVAILRAGGNAVDAAVATAFAVAVVDTGNAGVGGGGSILIYLSGDRRAEYAEFYSRAGSGRGDEGSARNVAIPGHVAGLLEAHDRFGQLRREAVLAPAIRLAEYGFPVSPELSAAIASHQSKIEEHAGDDAVALFLPDGEPLQPGDWLVQRQKAATLRRIAAGGRDGFYRGPVAETLVKDLNAAGNPATLEDLAELEVNWQRPVVGGFRQFTVMSAPPPLGGTQVIQPLAILDRFELAEHGLPAESTIVTGRITDAFRVGRLDYRDWVHDPETPVPGAGLTSPAYAALRSEFVDTGEVPREIPSGDPWAFDDEAGHDRFRHLDPYPPSARPGSVSAGDGGDTGEDEGPDSEHTTHLSVVDADRNAVAITMTLGPSFGAGFYSAGAFFNNGITRFSNSPEGNRWSDRRTPRSNTTPTIVLDGDQVRLVTGAQGGSRIPNAVVYNILYVLEYGLSASEAMAGPRAFPFIGSPTLRVERGFRGDTLSGLRARGYQVEPYTQQDRYFGGAQMIVVRPDGRLDGAADMRRSGAVAGY